jgi:hypothetical protein
MNMLQYGNLMMKRQSRESLKPKSFFYVLYIDEEVRGQDRAAEKGVKSRKFGPRRLIKP